MLLLLVHISGQFYCIRAASVLEVIPRVPLQPVPHAPASLAGLLHYRGDVIPVLDLRTLLADGASDAYLSTRIVVVEVGPQFIPREDAGSLVRQRLRVPQARSARYRRRSRVYARDKLEESPKRMGLIAERLTETLEVDASAIAPAPVDVAEAPFLGGLLVHDGRVVRELLVDRFHVEATA